MPAQVEVYDMCPVYNSKYQILEEHVKKNNKSNESLTLVCRPRKDYLFSQSCFGPLFNFPYCAWR